MGLREVGEGGRLIRSKYRIRSPQRVNMNAVFSKECVIGTFRSAFIMELRLLNGFNYIPLIILSYAYHCAYM